MSATTSNHSERLLRRAEAAKYVVEKYNVPCSPKTLAKLACVSSNGPPFRFAGTFPAVSDFGSRCLGALQNWAVDPIDVRSQHRRLIPEKRKPGGAIHLCKDQFAHAGLRKPTTCPAVSRRAVKSKAFLASDFSIGVRWSSTSLRRAAGNISVAGFPFLPVTLI